jgi:hypothetical protein
MLLELVLLVLLPLAALLMVFRRLRLEAEQRQLPVR